MVGFCVPCMRNTIKGAFDWLGFICNYALLHIFTRVVFSDLVQRYHDVLTLSMRICLFRPVKDFLHTLDRYPN